MTVLQAVAEMDAGPIWATETFAMPHEPVTKSSLYRAEVTEAAVRAVLLAVARVADPSFVPEPLDYSRARCARPTASVDAAVRPCRSIGPATPPRKSPAGSAPRTATPGVLTSCWARPSTRMAPIRRRVRGPAGQVIAQRTGAVCVGTVDGAIWLTHLKAKARTSEQRPAGIKLTGDAGSPALAARRTAQ